MVKSLQSLRFIFAIMIFLHHFVLNGKGLFEAGGTIGVSYFIILSGVVMSLGYYEKSQLASFSYKTFIKKRIIRLYPLHLLCLIGYIILNPGIISLNGILQLIPNFLMLQSWIPFKSIYFSGNAVSWCLSDMMFFYAIFPLLVKYIKILSKIKLTIISIIIFATYLTAVICIPEEYSHQILYISPLFRLLDFIIGIGIYNIYIYYGKNISKCITTSTASLIEICCIILLCGVVLLYKHVHINYMYALINMFVVGFLILITLTLDCKTGTIFNILRNKLLLKMGEVSFSFYMIHVLAMSIFNRIIAKYNITIDWELKLFIYFIIISIASIIIYNYFEKPVSKYLQKRFIS